MTNKLFASFGLGLTILILVGHHTVTLRFGECSESVRDPGLVVQYTEDLLAMSYQTSLQEVFEDLRKYKVAFDFSGKASTLFWSTIRYRVSGFTLTGYEPPKANSSITTAKGILVNISLPILRFKGRYTLNLHNGQWLQYSRRGNILVTISGATLELHIEFTLSEDRDRVNRTMPHCSATIEGIHVDLQDSISDSLLAGINWDEEVKPHQEQFCRIMRLGIDGIIELSYKFTKDIYLDISLLHKPAIYDGYFEIQHIGEVRYRGDETHFPRLPQPLVTNKPTNLVVYKMSDFIFNSFGYVVHNHKLLSFTYTKSDLPELRKHLLDTSCESECFGKLFPNASTRWPHSSVEISVTTSEPPSVQITPESFKVILEFNIEASARLTNDSAPLLFSIHLSVSSLVASSVKNNRICFQMKNPDANITTIESLIGDLPEDHLLVVINQAFQKILSPLIRQFAINGFDLEFGKVLSVNEYEFNLKNGHLSLLVISVNVKEKDLTDKQYILRVIVNLFVFSALR